MSLTSRVRTTVGLWALMFAALAVTIGLSVRNGTFERDWLFLSIAFSMIAGYGTVGAFVVARVPGNPIGWLLLAVAGAFLVAGLSDEYASYTLVTRPGALPGGTFMLWLSNWIFHAVIAPIPYLLLLFPSGRLPSRRWRPLGWALGAVFALGALATIVRPGIVQFATSTLENPTGVEALAGLAVGAQWVAGIAGIGLSLLCVAAFVMRFRTASGDERQQLRWLAYVSAVCGVAFVVALAAGLWGSALSNAAFFVFLGLLGIGVPIAIGIALLKYRLWDLDLVVKKAVVATIVIAALTVLSIVALLLLGGIVVGPISDRPELTLIAGLLIGALLWPILRISRRIADRVVYGGRATPYEVLSGFSDRMAESYATDDVLPRMASILAAGTGAERVTIWLLVDRELRPAARWPAGDAREEPSPDADLAASDPGTFEVRYRGELLGAITVRMPANDPMDPSKERLIRDLASQAGLVLRNVRLIEELRASRRRLVAAQDEERRKLERDIHDGAQQQLVALSVKLRLADQLIERDPAGARRIVDQLQAETVDALETLRDLARGIYPPLLADEGLTAALTSQIRRSPVPVELAPDGIARYGEEVEAAVYFCCLESLQNVAKYAGATAVSVSLRDEGDRLTFEVTDDGVGFDPDHVTRGLGLRGMADRLEAIGGRLEVRSSPGAGTTIAGVVPIRPT